MIEWEALGHNTTGSVYRAKVYGGWLVRISAYEAEALTFYPDPNHVWDGSSLP